MIQIIDNFISDKISKYCIDFFEQNIHLRKIYRCTSTINIGKTDEQGNFTGMPEFDNIFKFINNHTYKINKSVIEWIQIVKWPDDCNQPLHNDFASDRTVYSSIFYLNDGYFGGQTFFEEGTIIMPKKGRALFFNGVEYKHGVMPIKKGPRYTIAAWYMKDKNGSH